MVVGEFLDPLNDSVICVKPAEALLWNQRIEEDREL